LTAKFPVQYAQVAHVTGLTAPSCSISHAQRAPQALWREFCGTYAPPQPEHCRFL
jgi:hypothetical protein